MRNLLLRDLGWKLFSLLLAAFIWVTVHKIIGPQIPESATPAIPVTFGGVTVTVVGTSSPTTPMYHINSNSVSVTVAGPHEVMDVLRKNEIHAAVYLSDMEDPTRESMQPVNVSVPWGVTLVRVSPAAVRVIPPPQR